MIAASQRDLAYAEALARGLGNQLSLRVTRAGLPAADGTLLCNNNNPGNGTSVCRTLNTLSSPQHRWTQPHCEVTGGGGHTKRSGGVISLGKCNRLLHCDQEEKGDVYKASL